MAAMSERRRWFAVLLFTASGILACSGTEEPRLQPPPSDHTPTCIHRDETSAASFTLPGVTPVPYPSPRGGHVDPELDVPAFPGATEIDGFEAHGLSVQAFEARTTEAELFRFFEDELGGRGFNLTASSGGPAGGHSCTFDRPGESPVSPRPIVVVSTRWTDREGERTSPAPGFQGAGARFLPPAEGVIWFWVSTGRR
jgi:hypothetical protein